MPVQEKNKKTTIHRIYKLMSWVMHNIKDVHILIAPKRNSKQKTQHNWSFKKVYNIQKTTEQPSFTKT